jgi:heavy metal translocating P-type ATPase
MTEILSKESETQNNSKNPVNLIPDGTCYHCQNPIPKNLHIVTTVNEEQRFFCCTGCQTVSELISEMGKDYFYHLRGSSNLEPIVTFKGEDAENLDSELTYSEFVTGKDKTKSEVYVNITNIHCSACVWLNEKVLSETKGVHKVRINFSTGRAHIVWDDNLVKLSKIFSIIQSIGYIPKLYAPWKKEKANNNYATDLLIRVAVAAFSFGSIMAFTVSLYAGYFSGIDPGFKRLFHFYSWLLATPVYIYSGVPFFRGAYYGLKNKTLNMDFLLILGISLAYFYSVYVTLSDIGEVYFDSVCMIFFFVLVGKYLEAISRNIANRKINSLLSKLPEHCTLIENGIEKKVSANVVKKDDLILVKAGERLSVDGILESEQAHVDESFLTGESKPVSKIKGEKVYAGSLSISSGIYLRVLNASQNSTLSVLQRMIEDALLEKPSIQRKTDKIATKFISVVLSTSLASFIGWMLYSSNFEFSLISAISVLIVACPCALGLAIPSTLVINNIINSEKGIVLKNLDIIEPLSKLTTLIFDKTGTLTEGTLKVTEQSIKHSTLTKNLIYVLEKKSTHPIAKSIVTAFQEEEDYSQTQSEFQVTEINEVQGFGVNGIIKHKHNEYRICIGNLDFILKHTKSPGKVFENAKKDNKIGTYIHINVNHEYMGYLLLNDTPRRGIKEEIIKLKKIVKDIQLLSGDSQNNVKRISEELGIEIFKGELKPDEKLDYLTKLQDEKKIVAMVGDGINDAGILAKSNVGISLELASDISIDKADIILMKNDLRGVRLAIEYAKLTSRTIKQNIGISLLYNSIMLPLAAFGLMQPVYCALFMTLSSLTVVANSFLLKLYARKV